MHALPEINAVIARNNVQVAGNTAADKTMVFVHGFGTDQTAWSGVAPAFSKDFRLVLMDNAGAGNSDPNAFVQARYLKLNNYASDLLDVCRALELEDAVVVGHSIGAMIAVLAARAAPRHFSKLVLIGASPRYLNDEGYIGGLSKEDVEQIYRSITSDLGAWANTYSRLAMASPEAPQLAQAFSDTLKRIPPAQLLTTLYSILQSDHRAEIAALDKPTLLIQTQDDAIVPLSVAQFMQRTIRQSQLKIINARGHLPHISTPDEVVAAMREFVYSA